MNSRGEDPWEIRFSKQASKDALLLARSGLKPKAERLLNIMAEDPFRTPPSYEKLLGNLQSMYSRRINIHHRLVYSLDISNRHIFVVRMWSHYEF